MKRTKLAPCPSCGLKIPEFSRICSNCKEHRQRWRNELKYWGGITGLATLVLSGSAVSFDYLQRVYDRNFATPLSVVNFDPFGKTIVANTSLDTITIQYVRARSTRPYRDLLWDILEPLKSGEVLIPKLEQISLATWEGSIKHDYGGSRVGNYAALDMNTFEHLRSDLQDVSNQYIPSYLTPAGATVNQLKLNLSEGTSTIRFFDCEIEIGYIRPPDSKVRTIRSACTGTFREKTQSSK